MLSRRIAGCVLWAVSCSPFAQPVATVPMPETGAVLVKLHQPLFPPLANQAGISGDVELNITVQESGTVGSVAVISGHPLLTPAAMESIAKSQFECSGCTQPATYSMTYSFVAGDLLRDGCTEGTADSQSLRRSHEQVSFADHHVTIVGPFVALCPSGPYGPIPKVRSAKCLYLWRCRTPHVGFQ